VEEKEKTYSAVFGIGVLEGRMYIASMTAKLSGREEGSKHSLNSSKKPR